MKNKNDQIIQWNSIKGILVIVATVIFFSIFFYEDKFLSCNQENNKYSTIEYLKLYCKSDLKKIVVLTKGHYSKFDAICEFVIHDKIIIHDFKSIISKQSLTKMKRTSGQTGRETHITLYNDKNETYSFILNGDPYSGNRPLNEIEISFFLNPSFDVSENWLPAPQDAINKNIRMYRPKGGNLQNYELYYFLKKHIIDFTEENRKNTEGISGKCYITKQYK